MIRECTGEAFGDMDCTDEEILCDPRRLRDSAAE